MTYDQRRIYGTAVGLVFFGFGALVLVQGNVGGGVLLLACGLGLSVGALTGRALRRRVDDTSDPRSGSGTEGSRWAWVMSGPQMVWHVVTFALLGALVGYAADLAFGAGPADALAYAATFGGITLLVQAWKLNRWKAAGRPTGSR